MFMRCEAAAALSPSDLGAIRAQKKGLQSCQRSKSVCVWLRLTPTLLQFQLKHKPPVSTDPDPETKSEEKSSRFLRVRGGRLLARSLGEADWSPVVAAGV